MIYLHKRHLLLAITGLAVTSLWAQSARELMQEIGGESVSASSAEEKEGSSRPVLFENAPDNSAGFSVFSKRIPPLPENALPAKILYRNGRYNQPVMMTNSEIPHVWSGTKADGTPVVVSYIRENSEGIHLSKPVKDTNRSSFSGDIREATIAAQPLELTPFIDALFKKLAGLHTDQNWEARSIMANPGQLMLLAVRLHQVGETDAANQLAAFLFEEVGDKKQVLMAGLSTITDVAYEDLLTTFSTTGDSNAFVADAEKLLAEQGKFWRHSAQLAERIPEWKKIITLPADYVPEVNGITLTEAQKDLYRTLTTNAPVSQAVSGFLQNFNWLLVPKSLLNTTITSQLQYTEIDKETASAVRKTLSDLHALGPEAFPILITMLADPRFTPPNADSEYNSMQITRRYMRMGGRESAPLPEPQALNAIALEILEAINPGEIAGWEGDSAEEVTAPALAFYQSLKGKSAEEMALIYLQSAEEWSMPEEALYTLLASKDPKNRETAEAKIRQSENSFQYLGLVTEYIRYQEAAGKSLLRGIREKLVAQAEERGSMGGMDSYYKQMLTRVDKLLEEPEKEDAQEDKPDLATVLDTWIADKDYRDPSNLISVYEAAKTSTDLEFQQLIANRLQNASPELQGQLIQMVSRVVDEGGVSSLSPMDMMGGGSDQLKFYVHRDTLPKEGEADVEVDAEDLYGWIPGVWNPLLDQQDSPKKQTLSYTLAHTIVLTELAYEEELNVYYAIALGFSHTREKDRKDLATIAKKLIDEDSEWEEAVALVPSETQVTEERKLELKTLIHEGEPGKAKDAILNASPSERLYLYKLATTGEMVWRDELGSLLVPVKNRFIPSLWSEQSDFTTLKPGQAITIKDMESLIAYAQDQAKKGKNGFILLRPLPMFDGTEVMNMTENLPAHYRREKGVKIQMYFNEFRFAAEIDPETSLTLKKPTQEDIEQADSANSDFLALMGGGDEAKTDDQGTKISVAVDQFLNTPSAFNQLNGNFMIMYCGTPDTEDERRTTP
jgi:hypothetical protein